VLFAIGTDQLKGFAITLVLGLALNLFTAVFCSRVVFDLAERSRWLRKLSMGRIFGHPNLQFVRWSRAAATVAVTLIALGAIAVARRGSELFDIDFTGGTSVQVEFKEGKELPVAEVRKLVTGRFESATVSAVTLADGVSNRRFKIDTGNQDQDAVQRLLQEAFPGRLATHTMSFGEIEAMAAADAAQPAEEGASPAGPRFLTGVPLTFPEKIGKPALDATLSEAVEAVGAGDAEFELVAIDQAVGDTTPSRDWALSTSLDPDTTRKVLERMVSNLADTPVYLSANAIGGVVALVHDVAIALACLALSRYVAPFMGWALVDEFRISLDVVAALLTIVGFSINDTIVIFDRLREIRGKARFITADMVDRAVNQTLSRTILTSGTAFLAVLILYACWWASLRAPSVRSTSPLRSCSGCSTVSERPLSLLVRPS